MSSASRYAQVQYIRLQGDYLDCHIYQGLLLAGQGGPLFSNFWKKYNHINLTNRPNSNCEKKTIAQKKLQSPNISHPLILTVEAASG